MKLETFFEKFEQFADAPGAVAKMRELVLELAVQGRLTQQLPSDDSVKNLLEKIYAEKVSLVNEGLLKKAERIEPLSNDLQKPSQWTLAPLAALCVSVTDGDHLPPPKAENGVPFLVISDVRWGGIEFTDCRHVSEGYFKKLDWIRKPLKCDILYTLVGSFGIPVVVKDSKPFCVQRHIGILRPSKHIELHYLAYALASKLVFRQAALVATGIAQKTVPLAGLRKIVIPLPPLAEQKRIVAKVDELMALCDRLEAQQQERETRHAALARASLARFADAPTPANLPFLFHASFTISPSDLRKSILTLAVQGKLVPQDSNDEPAECSLARNDERRRGTARSDHRADEENRPLLSGDDRWDIADTWSWRGLADLVLFVDYRGKTPAKLSSGVRLLTAKNVRKGQINLSPEEFLSEDEYHAWMTRGFPKAGDILFTTEAPMGNAAVVELTERFALAQRVICFQTYGAIDPAFLVLQILSDQFQFILDKNGTGVTAKGIKASKLKQLPVAIPPLAEQRRIVAKVDHLMAMVDQLEIQLTTARASAANLLDAIVAELTGTTRDPRSATRSSSSTPGTGRRGRPRKTA